jgi:hypothetical protein
MSGGKFGSDKFDVDQELSGAPAEIEAYYWETEESHSTNEITMNDYLDCHLDDSFEVIEHGGTLAVILSDTGIKYEVHASGNGDFNHHKVEFVLID